MLQWFKQLWLLWTYQQFKPAIRQPFTTSCLLFSPILILTPLLLLTWTLDNGKPIIEPECYKRPIALPTGSVASSAKYLQSLVCGFDLGCLPATAATPTRAQNDPNSLYDRSILPRWWADVMLSTEIITNETKFRHFTQFIASAAVLLDAYENWHNNATVRTNVVKWIDEKVEMMSFFADVDDGNNTWGKNISATADSRSQLSYVTRRAQRILKSLENLSGGNDKTSDSNKTGGIVLSVLFPDENNTEALFIRAIVFKELESLTSTGLTEARKTARLVMLWQQTSPYVAKLFKLSLPYWAELRVLLEKLPKSNKFETFYETPVCGLPAHALKQHIGGRNSSFSKATTSAASPNVFWPMLIRIISQTGFDSNIMTQLIQLLIPNDAPVPEDVLQIEVLLKKSAFYDRRVNYNNSFPANASHYCVALEQESHKVLLSNIGYSMLKQVVYGRVLYYCDGLHHNDRTVADELMKMVAFKLSDIRLSLAYPLQLLNWLTNVGFARKQLLSVHNDRLLTKVLSKYLQSTRSTSVTEVTKTVDFVDIVHYRSLLDEVVPWLNVSLRMVDEVFGRCLPWLPTTDGSTARETPEEQQTRIEQMYERAPPSAIGLQRRARELDNQRQFLAAIAFSALPPKNDSIRRVKYELQLDVDKIPSLPQMSEPMDSVIADSVIVSKIQFYLNVLPLQSVLDRSIIEFYDNSNSTTVVPDTVYVEAFPKASTSSDLQYVIQRSYLPLLIMLALTLGTGAQTRQLVAARAPQLNQLLRLHGMKRGVRSCAWWVWWLAMWAVVAATIILFERYVIHAVVFGSFWLNFLILYTTFVCQLALCFVIASLCVRCSPAVAAGVAVAVLLLSLVPAFCYVANRLALSFSTIVALHAVPIVPLFALVTYSSRYESAHIGLTFDNWSVSTEPWDCMSPQSTLFVLLIYAGVYLLAGVLIRVVSELYVMNAAFTPVDSAKSSDSTSKIGNNHENVVVQIEGLTKIYRIRTSLLAQVFKFLPFRPRKSETPLNTITALENLSFSLCNNELTCLLGPNGAGKSTLLSILCGFVQSTSGQINFISTKNRISSKNAVSYCPQNNILFDHLTVSEHIRFYFALNGRKSSAASCTRAHTDMDLQDSAHRYVTQLGAGHRRKLMLAIAFACNDKRLVLLDEPCANVDADARESLWKLIARQTASQQQQTATHRAVLVCTHHIAEAERFADRILMMKAGRLIVNERCSDLFEKFMNFELLPPLPRPTNIRNHSTALIWNLTICTATQQYNKLDVSFVTDLVRQVFGSALLQSHVANHRLTDSADGYYGSAPTDRFCERWKFMICEGCPASKRSTLLQLLFATSSSPFPSSSQQMNPDENRSVLMQKAGSFQAKNNSFHPVINRVQSSSTSPLFVSVDFDTPDLTDVYRAVVQCPTADTSHTQKHPDDDDCGDSKCRRTEFANHPTIFVRFVKFLCAMPPFCWSLFARHCIILFAKRLLYYCRSLRQTFTVLSVPMILIAVASFVAQFDRQLISLSNKQNGDQRELVLQLDPASTLWQYPTFYDGFDSISPTSSSRLLELLQTDDDFNQPNRENCYKCDETFTLKQQMYQLKRHWLTNSSNPDHEVKQTNITGDFFTLHVLLKNSSAASSFLKARNTVLPQLAGGYSFLPSTTTVNESAVKVWYNPAYGWSPAQYLSRLHAALFKLSQATSTRAHRLDHTNHTSATTIDASVRPLPFTPAQQRRGSVTQLLLQAAAANVLMFGLTFVPACAIGYVVAERRRGERNLQQLAGLGPLPYWLVAFLFDYLVLYGIVMAFCWLIIGCIWPIDIFTFDDKYFHALFAAIALYGLNALGICYLLSFLFNDSHVAFVVTYASLCCLGFVSTLLVNPDNFFRHLLGGRRVYRLEDDRLLIWLVPSYNIGQAVLQMMTQKFESFGYEKVLCSVMSTRRSHRRDVCGEALQKDPFGWKTTGRHLFAMAVSSAVCFFLVVFIDWLKANWSTLTGAVKWTKIEPFTNHYSVSGASNNHGQLNRRHTILKCSEILSQTARRRSKICQLSKIDDDNNIHQDISFEVQAGESCALVGPNGSGKSAVLKTIIGQIRTGGHVILSDSANSTESTTTCCRRNNRFRIGYCPQTEPLDPACTAYEHLLFYAIIKNVAREHITSDIGQLIQNFDIKPDCLHAITVCGLSGGTRRKLTAALALLNRPRLVLMDGGTSGVDSVACVTIRNTLCQYARDEHAAVLYTAHKMLSTDGAKVAANDEQQTSASRMVVLKRDEDGQTRVVVDDSLRAVCQRFASAQLFFVTITFSAAPPPALVDEFHANFQKFCCTLHSVSLSGRVWQCLAAVNANYQHSTNSLLRNIDNSNTLKRRLAAHFCVTPPPQMQINRAVLNFLSLFETDDVTKVVNFNVRTAIMGDLNCMSPTQQKIDYK